jgi:uncharacterized protein YkwD
MSQRFCLAASLGLVIASNGGALQACPTDVAHSRVANTSAPTQIAQQAPGVAPTVATASPAPQASHINDLLALTNSERQRQGLAPLRLSTSLNQAAQRHAEDLGRNRIFSHTGSDGSQMIDRARAAGYLYSFLGENIAAGNATPALTIQQWMNSPGHRSNILKGEFSEVGFGYVSDPSSPYRYYWVQVFGRPQ